MKNILIKFEKLSKVLLLFYFFNYNKKLILNINIFFIIKIYIKIQLIWSLYKVSNYKILIYLLFKIKLLIIFVFQYKFFHQSKNGSSAGFNAGL